MTPLSLPPGNPPRHRVLVVSHDVIGRQMAGPGIRYFHMARVLAPHAQVTLAVYHPPEQDPARIVRHLRAELPGVDPVAFSAETWAIVGALAEEMDVVVMASDVAAILPGLGDLPAALVIDGYDPLLAEWLATHPGVHEENWDQWRLRMVQLGMQMRVGDFFLCASERQRDWWLGQLEAHGRLNPRTLADDPALRRLVDVVSYGVPGGEPLSQRPVVRSMWPQIGPDRRIVLWGGGLWPWLDPQTAIRAVAQLHPAHPEICLIFPGTVHPNPEVAKIPGGVAEARALAAALGVLDKAVFFGQWVDYGDWPSLLLECRVALSLHHDTLETRLAFRSRVLEYLWAGLPVVSSAGDATGDLAVAYGLGICVAGADVDATAEAILAGLALSPADRMAAAGRARRELAWEQVMRPLIDFCQSPRRAADRRPGSGAQPARPVGNPFYLDQINHWQVMADRAEHARHQAEQSLAEAIIQRDQARQTVRAYEQGRFMTLMRWIHGVCAAVRRPR